MLSMLRVLCGMPGRAHVRPHACVARCCIGALHSLAEANWRSTYSAVSTSLRTFSPCSKISSLRPLPSLPSLPSLRSLRLSFAMFASVDLDVGFANDFRPFRELGFHEFRELFGSAA